MSFVVSVFGLAVLAISPVAAASHGWVLNVFEPTDTISGREVGLEYKVASTDPDHEFKITLLQNGNQTDNQSITNPYGGSGTFAVTVPAAGSYSFTVTAQELGSAETESVTRTVTFGDAPQATTTTVYRTISTSNGNNSSSVATVASSESSNSSGRVSDAAASVTKDTPNTLGAATNTTDTKKNITQAANNDDQPWLWAIPVGLIVAGAAYYRFVYGQGKGPFVQK